MARQTDQSEDKQITSTTKNNWYNSQTGGRGMLYGAGAVIVLIIVFLLGAAVTNHRVNRVGGFFGGPGMVSKRIGIGGERGFMRAGGFDGSITNGNGQTRTSGVVTSVNGSSFTLAGNGSTTNVTTSSSTQYQDGNSVAQNDTVIVLGTKSGDTLNATSIVINP